jgi:hypothetical protein
VSAAGVGSAEASTSTPIISRQPIVLLGDARAQRRSGEASPVGGDQHPGAHPSDWPVP